MKGLTGLLFVGLLVVNVQVGNGDNLYGMVGAEVTEAKAAPAWCDPMPKFCTIDIWGNIIFGEFHYGIPDPLKD